MNKEKGNIQQIIMPLNLARKEIKMDFEEKDKMNTEQVETT